MNAVKFACTCIATALTGVAFFLTLARADDKLPCPWKSKTPPNALEGNVGTPSDSHWYFTHISDVDKDGDSYHFVFQIDNNHPNSLKFAWYQSDPKHTEPVLQCSDLKQGGCISNDTHTHNPFAEDSNAYIKYGPMQQNTKPYATLYIPEQKSGSQNPVASAPVLDSRIVADLQREGGEAEHLELEFMTKTEGSYFSYTVINRGSQKVLFKIPVLSNKLRKIEDITVKSTWTSEGDAFVAIPDSSQTYAIQLTKVLGFQETQALLEVHLPTSKTEAAGQVTAYIPLEANYK
jgi:hypothetical protein